MYNQMNTYYTGSTYLSVQYLSIKNGRWCFGFHLDHIMLRNSQCDVFHSLLAIQDMTYGHVQYYLNDRK